MKPYSALALLLALTLLYTPSTSMAQVDWQDFSALPDPELQWNPNGLRGGFGFNVPPRTRENLLRAQGQIRGVCGFNFSLNLISQLARLIEGAEDMIAPLLAGFAFSVICQTVPSICDIFKDARQAGNFTLRMQRASCQDLMKLGQLAGMTVFNEANTKCVQEVLAETGDMDEAIESCNQGGTGVIEGPGGLEATTVSIVDDLLARAGVPEEIAEGVTDLLPSLVITASSTDYSIRPDRSLERVQEASEDIALEIEQAVSEAEAGIEPTPVQVPDGPIGTTEIEALVQMGPGLEREYHIGKLAAGYGHAKIIWDMDEAAKILEQSAIVTDLSQGQREKVDRTVIVLHNERDRLTRMKRVMEENVAPEIEALRSMRANRESWTSRVITKTNTTRQQSAYIAETGQTEMGYAW